MSTLKELAAKVIKNGGGSGRSVSNANPRSGIARLHQHQQGEKSEKYMKYEHPPFENYEHFNEYAFRLFALNFYEWYRDAHGFEASITKEMVSNVSYTWEDIYLNQHCESPIELLLVAGLLFTSNGYEYFDTCSWDYTEYQGGKPENVAKDIFTVVIPQAKIGGYRVDFLFITKAGDDFRRFVVECDGHDFHERTKQQASRDKRRDRELTRLNIPVLRYTGSDIYKAPMKCCEEIGEYACLQLEEMLFKQGKIAVDPHLRKRVANG